MEQGDIMKEEGYHHKEKYLKVIKSMLQKEIRKEEVEVEEEKEKWRVDQNE